MSKARLFLLLALLPGLLVSSGASLRICLQDVLGLELDCAGCEEDTRSCCGASESSSGPAASSDELCSTCCIALEAQARKLAGAPRADDLGAQHAPLALAPLCALPLRPGPERANEPTRGRRGSRLFPAAPGILPLRI